MFNVSSYSTDIYSSEFLRKSTDDTRTICGMFAISLHCYDNCIINIFISSNQVMLAAFYAVPNASFSRVQANLTFRPKLERNDGRKLQRKSRSAMECVKTSYNRTSIVVVLGQRIVPVTAADHTEQKSFV